jgi:hypothetical protein
MGQHVSQQLLEVVGDVDLVRKLYVQFGDAAGLGSPAPGQSAKQHAVEDDPQAPDVTLEGPLFSAEHLGSSVSVTGTRVLKALISALKVNCHFEVGHLGLVIVEQHADGFQPPVQDVGLLHEFTGPGETLHEWKGLFKI